MTHDELLDEVIGIYNKYYMPEIKRLAEALQAEIALLAAAQEAYRLLGKVVPGDQNSMINWAVKSKDSVYTNAGAAYRILGKALGV